jgi:hypothetical protein
MTMDASGHARAAAILARLDRLPATRHVWLLITMVHTTSPFELVRTRWVDVPRARGKAARA